MDVGIFSAGLKGIVRPVPWDAFASASAPGPLVRALLGEIDAPFVAIAVRDEGDAWAEGANRAQVVDLPVKADGIVVTRLGDHVTTTVDDEDSAVSFPELEKLINGDGTVLAHRLVGSAWVAEAFPL